MQPKIIIDPPTPDGVSALLLLWTAMTLSYESSENVFWRAQPRRPSGLQQITWQEGNTLLTQCQVYSFAHFFGSASLQNQNSLAGLTGTFPGFQGTFPGFQGALTPAQKCREESSLS